MGKTAGRGTKGTRARGTVPAGFEGGQLPLHRRLPKIGGFTPPSQRVYSTVNVGRLAAVAEGGQSWSPPELADAGLIRRGSQSVKVLGDGELDVAISVSAHAFSASARRKIEAAGGTVTELPESA
jgi:large subunit ribosomal protein L15